MSNIINYYPSIKNVEFNQIPEINKPTMDLFANFVKCDFNSKSKGLALQTRIKDLRELSCSLEKDKKYDTLHKVLSVALLVTGIVLCTLVCLSLYLTPVIPGLGGIIPAVYDAIVHALFGGPSLVLTGAASIYIFDSFNKIDWKGKKINKKIDSFNKEIEILKKIQEHSPLIRQKIEMELKQVDLIQRKSIDYARIYQLRIALRQLDKTKVFLENLNGN